MRFASPARWLVIAAGTLIVSCRPDARENDAAVRDTVASFAQAVQIIGELARHLPKQLPRESLGSMIGIAHSAEFEPDTIDVELGFMLNTELPDELPRLGSRSLYVRELPAVEHMAACVRVGPPLSASGSRPGSAEIVSGGAAGVELMTMLWSPSIGGVGPAILNRLMSWPLLLAVLLATMLLVSRSE